MKPIILIVFFSTLSISVFAQKDTLPAFTAKSKDGLITLSWINAYKNATQINIQRSRDSNRNFVTIHSTPNPDAKNYSYIDKTAKNDSGYYRIFVLFEGTNYIFTKAKRAVKEVATVTAKPSATGITSGVDSSVSNKEKPDAQINGTGPAGINGNENKVGGKLRAPVNAAPVKKVWEPSIYVYTGDDGNIVINLPDAATKKYALTIAKEEGRPVFVINHVKEVLLTLDKAVFLRSGWYYFELREDGKVKERNKFLITRDN